MRKGLQLQGEGLQAQSEGLHLQSDGLQMHGGRSTTEARALPFKAGNAPLQARMIPA